MGKLRIYELAKELGVENKEVIAKAMELGIPGKSSHSNSLEDSEADLLRRAFIRQAIGNAPDREVVKTRVDERTGETKTIVESRKGNVVRRRRKVVVEDKSTPVQAAPQESVQHEEPVGLASAEAQVDASDIFEAPSGEVARTSEEAASSLEGEPRASEEGESLTPSEALADTTVSQASQTEEASQVKEATSVSEEPPKPEKKVAGPKVLGKIDLPQRRTRTEREDTDLSENESSEDSDGSGRRGKKGKKRKGRLREFNRGDLLDYEGRPQRRTGKGSKAKGGREEEGLDKEQATEITTPKASKRVIKMADEVITVGDFAKQMSVKAGEVITKLIGLGVMATINQVIDVDTATLVADEFGFSIEQTGFDEVDILNLEEDTAEGEIGARPPVVTVMGHVDHGKTSLLDTIRKTSVAEREHGGITQHIGAYNVSLEDGHTITFIDTPGHAAFTSMRARGAEVTDLVVLLVAADDGVMPQTVEAVNHAKAAGVVIVVAVNKMDKVDANPDRVKQQLSELGLQPEDWGGDTMYFPVSALTGDGVPELLEGIALQAEMKELSARTSGLARGTIIEARQEIGRGTVATVLVQKGELKVGDIFVSGAEYGRVRSMVNHNDVKLEHAGPSIPVEITGLNGVPLAGDDFIVVDSESISKQVAENRKQRILQKEQLQLAGGPISLEEFARRATQEQAEELNVIIKADVGGSLEAVRESIEKLSTPKVQVRVIHGAVGGVNESDIQLAIASRAIVIGFNVRGEPRAIAEAEATGVEVRFYRVIYELLDDVKNAMQGLLAPIKEEVSLARVEVRDTFSVPKIGTVAGCYVLDGTVKRGAFLRLLRDSVVVHEGKMLNLRRFKDDVKEVQSGYECGISIDGYNDIKSGDVMEVFEFKEVAATL